MATAGAGADRRRRTDVLNVCKTLDDFRVGLLNEGYILSRQALYLRLRNVRMVPVKLRKTQNNLRNRHKNPDFTFPAKQFLQDIVALFG